MIGGVRGKLERVDIDVATIETAGGVFYEILVPLGDTIWAISAADPVLTEIVQALPA